MRRLGPLVLLFCAAQAARHDISECGTSRDTPAKSVFLHRQSERVRAARRASGAAIAPPNDRDIGNIAIIEDSDGVVERLNQFNLNGTSIAFTPSSADASRYTYSTGAQFYESQAADEGSPLVALDDDDSREYA